MSLRLALIQTNIMPDNVSKNIKHYQTLLENIDKDVDIIIFPELFNTGISATFGQFAETMEGKSTLFLQQMAQQHNCDVVASLAIKINEKIYNRLVWVTPDGMIDFYDKKHLFFGDEKLICSTGTKRTVIERANWKFLPLICYDIRFPLWCRNQFINQNFMYDVLIFIANFPQARIGVLQTLAKARAIENQAYVIVVNRIGEDGNGTAHNGHSMIVDPLGKIITQITENEEIIIYGEINKRILLKVREKLVVAPDWDNYSDFN